MPTNNTENEAAHHNAGKVGAKAGHCRDQTPSDGEEGQVQRWASKVVEKQVRRHLAKNVAYKQDGEP